MIVIEHNLDVIDAADWIVDLGPEGGDAGGEIVATGTPADVRRAAASHTGRALLAHDAAFSTQPLPARAHDLVSESRDARCTKVSLRVMRRRL